MRTIQISMKKIQMGSRKIQRVVSKKIQISELSSIGSRARHGRWEESTKQQRQKSNRKNKSNFTPSAAVLDMADGIAYKQTKQKRLNLKLKLSETNPPTP